MVRNSLKCYNLSSLSHGSQSLVAVCPVQQIDCFTISFIFHHSSLLVFFFNPVLFSSQLFLSFTFHLSLSSFHFPFPLLTVLSLWLRLVNFSLVVFYLHLSHTIPHFLFFYFLFASSRSCHFSPFKPSPHQPPFFSPTPSPQSPCPQLSFIFVWCSSHCYCLFVYLPQPLGVH